MKQRIVIAVLAVLVLDCASAITQLAPEAEAVRVVTDAAAVRDCTLLGYVENERGGLTSRDAENRLRNKAAALRADTLLLTARGIQRGMSGAAYGCGSPTGLSPDEDPAFN